MRSFRTLALAVSAAALLAAPAAAPASTTAAAPPEVVEEVLDCATATVGAYYRLLQGEPQMYYCTIEIG